LALVEDGGLEPPAAEVFGEDLAGILFVFHDQGFADHGPLPLMKSWTLPGADTRYCFSRRGKGQGLARAPARKCRDGPWAPGLDRGTTGGVPPLWRQVSNLPISTGGVESASWKLAA